METTENRPVADPELAKSLVEPLYSGRTLSTGEPVLAHAEGVAKILVGIRNDPELLAAAYLYSVPKFVANSEDWITKSFGSTVAGLVAELSKMNDLASRLQTLRWFATSGAEGAKEFGAETLAIYAPLANRLGIWQIKWELEDLSLRFTRPEEYREIANELDESREERLEFMQHAVEKVRALLKAHGIEADISGRPKHIYSIWKKMQRKHLRFDQLFDVRALRIIVGTVEQCYEVLSIVQENFTILSKEYDDYIANPKPNGYQSLHTVVTDKAGRPIEIQIRTRAMHEFAELGVAAHWRYKEAGNSNGASIAEEQRVAWLRQLLAWRSDMGSDPHKDAHAVEDDHVYCLTPQGRVVELPAGATPVDFAYLVHTQLGHRCRGARVDGAMVPLNTKLKTGQTVEIIAGKTGQPSDTQQAPAPATRSVSGSTPSSSHSFCRKGAKGSTRNLRASAKPP